MDYEKDIEYEAVSFLQNHDDMIKEAIKEGQDFDRNDISGLDTAFHEGIVDRSYSIKDAAEILENSEHVETDSGLWEGLDVQDQLSAQAAWSYSNDVWFKLEELYNEFKEQFEALFDQRLGSISEEERETLDEDELKDKVVEEVWKDFIDSYTIKPIPAGGQKEYDILKEWLELGKRAGCWAGYPLGRSYIDARCGSGHGMPEIKDFVDFDHEAAKKVPSMAGKYKETVMARVEELEKSLSKGRMKEPQVIIVVEGGVVTNVATSLPGLTYRIIDIDAIKSGEQSFGVDQEADAMGMDIEEYSEMSIQAIREILPDKR